MQDDKVIYGATIGLAAGVVKNLLNIALQWLHLIDSHFCNYAAGMFMKEAEVNTPAGIVAGYLADFTLSMILGVVFVYYMVFTGMRRPLLKGLIFGVAVWFLIYGGLTALGITCYRETHAVHGLIQFVLHVVFGLSLGVLVRKRIDDM